MYRVLLAAALIVTPVAAGAGTVSELLLHPPRAGLGPGPEADAPVGISIRYEAPPTDADLADLESGGAEVRRTASGRPAQVGRVVVARAPRSVLRALGARPGVVSIEPLVDVRAPADLWNLEATGVLGVWSPPPPALGTLGRGAVIGLFDQGCDLLHPTFFRPDAGVYAFQDAPGGDGTLGSGDLVDLDGDGTFESPLSLLSDEGGDGYRPGRGWLYVDTDGDGRWSRGAEAGFGEDDPAYGEPIFLGDDVNGDGEVSGGERLVRLGTSKIRAAFKGSRLYRRGLDLAEWPPRPEGAATAEAIHCTLTLALMIGGWPGLTRVRGLAPEAEVVAVDTYGAVEALPDVIDLGATVHLYEYGRPTYPGDGASNEEVALSDAAAAGYVEVVPTGNAAGSDGLMRLAPLPEDPTPIGLQITSTDRSELWINLVWIGERTAPLVDFLSPDGSGYRWSGAPYDLGVAGPYGFECWFRDTGGRTSQLLCRVTPEEGGVLTAGRLTLQLAHAPGTGDVPLIQGRLWAGSWLGGVRWTSNTTDSGTATAPSTADLALTVGAWLSDGSLAFYSGRGPRIDGAPLVDLVAPANVLSDGVDGTGAPQVYDFGGTSAAAPHVTAGAALLKALEPSLGHAEVEARLGSSASEPPDLGAIPNEDVGRGLLRVDAAVLGAPVPYGAPPAIRLTVDGEARVGQAVRVRAEVFDFDGDADAAQVSWDVGYDRDYELGPSADREVVFVPAEAGTVPVVARATDPTGRTSRALAVVEVAPAGGIADGGSDGGAAEDGAGLADDAGAAEDGSAAEDGGGTPDGGVGGSGDGASAVDAGESAAVDGGGCGCSAAGAPSLAPWGALALFAIVRRRRRPPADVADRGPGTRGGASNRRR